MNDQQSKYFFLGGNTADGFYSLYDSLVSYNEGDFLWVIKGGAGCGKSSLMRKIGIAAQKAGYGVEYVVCSGDPNSLDGIYIPGLKTAYMDGTAPHVADVNMAAADSAYLDLGQFYDHGSISAHRQELIELQNSISPQYKKAYSLLLSAGVLRRGWQKNFPTDDDIQRAKQRIDGIIKREIGTKHRTGGRITRRFLSAHTCKGICCFKDTALLYCDSIISLESKLGLAPAQLGRIADAAASAGHKVILCLDPLTPEMPEGVLIPGLSLGFVSSGSALAALTPSRRIHLDPKGDCATQKKLKGELQRFEKMSSTLKNEAITALASAKNFHDRIEGIYNPHVDFSAVHSVADEHIHRLGLK